MGHVRPKLRNNARFSLKKQNFPENIGVIHHFFIFLPAPLPDLLRKFVFKRFKLFVEKLLKFENFIFSQFFLTVAVFQELLISTEISGKKHHMAMLFQKTPHLIQCFTIKLFKFDKNVIIPCPKKDPHVRNSVNIRYINEHCMITKYRDFFITKLK